MRLLALVAGLMICAHGVGAADPRQEGTQRKARADKRFEEGKAYLAHGDYAHACAAFEQSQQLAPSLATQLQLAACIEQWGHTVDAYRAYVEAERLAELRFDDRGKLAHRKVVELSPRVPRLQLAIPADAIADAEILLDGTPVDPSRRAELFLVEPGPHEVEVRVPGRPPMRLPVDLQRGERKTVTVDAPGLRAKHDASAGRIRRRYLGGMTMSIGGAVMFGTASVVAVLARADYNDTIQRCPDLVCAKRRDYVTTQNARTRAQVMTFVGGAGLVLAGLGVYYVMTSRVRVMPTAGAESVGVAIAGAL